MLQGIREIKKTSTVGLVDTYTIYYTSGVQTTFTVTNGKDATISNAGFGLQFDPQSETFYVDNAVIATIEQLNSELAKVNSALTSKVDDLAQTTTQSVAELTSSLTDNVNQLNDSINEQSAELTEKIESEVLDRKTAVDNLATDTADKLSNVDARIATVESTITEDVNNKIIVLTDQVTSLADKVDDNATQEAEDIKIVQSAITAETNNRAAEVAYDISVTVDETDSNVLHISLLNKSKQPIASTTINLPAGVQSARLDTVKKQLIITLANASEVTCDVGGIIDELTKLSDSIEFINTTVSSIKTSIEQLDYSSSGTANQTITSLAQVDGKISAEYTKIQIDQNQVTDLAGVLDTLQTNIDSGDAQTVSTAKDYVDTVKTSLDSTISQVKSLIPAEASTDNQLADKDFVDNAISDTIATLDYTTTDGAVNKTVTSLIQADGVIKVGFADIQLEQTQITDLTDALESLQTDIATGDAETRTYADNIKTNLDSHIAQVEMLIPAEAATDNKLADKNFVNSTVLTKAAELTYTNTDGATSKTITSLSQTDGKIEAEYNDISITEAQVQNLSSDLSTLQASIESATSTLSQSVKTITTMIPAEATSTNQLADKDFVNSSISTATATFRGTVNTLTELKSLTGDLNDYAFVKIIDTTTGLVKQYDRYKYTPATSTETGNWTFEYTLNNSSFTEKQWKAINSGATTDLVTQITETKTGLTAHTSNISNPHNVTREQVGLGNVVNTSDSAIPVQDGTTKFTTGGAYTELAKKVDKVDGKALSSNDFTDDLKTKLEGIATGAQKNTVESVAGKTGEITLTKSDVELGNVDNTSDASLFTNISNTDTNLSLTIGGTTKSISGIKAKSAITDGADRNIVNTYATKSDVTAQIAAAITAALEASY